MANSASRSALLTIEDMRVFVDRCTRAESIAYRNADELDYTTMRACRRDRDALDAQVSGEEDNGLHIAACLRIHHGYMAFGS